MSGETEKLPSGWTVDTLAAHWMELRRLDEKLYDEREIHLREMLGLVAKFNDSHFAQLNENAKRTIEERGHFVSNEAFGPFKDAVLEQLAAQAGGTKGVDRFVGWAVAAASITVAIVVALTR